jgi:hypothetical protein
VIARLLKATKERNGSELLFDVFVNFNNVYDADLRAAALP